VATNNTAQYAASRSSTNSTAATSTSLWSFTSFTYGHIGELYANGQSNRPIFASVSDADFDRQNDNLWLSNRFFGLMRVIDQDTNAPATANVNLPGAGAAEFVVATNGTAPGADIRSISRRTGNITAVSDGELAASGSQSLQFVFGARDTHTGVSRGTSGSTNEVMSFSLGTNIVGNVGNYNSTLSTAQTSTNRVLTNYWTFANGFFGDTLINALIASSTGHPVRVTIPDIDDDRANDRAVTNSVFVGTLRVVDDDVKGPVVSTLVVDGAGGDGTSFYESFEPATGWTNILSFNGSWTNAYSNGTFIASGNVLWGSLDPKVTGTRRIGLQTNVAQTITWLQLPPVNDPGTLTLMAGRFSGVDVDISLEWASNTTWQSLGSLTVTNLNPEFEMFSWNINMTGITTLRLVRASTPGPQVYVDDISITPISEWISTNQLTMRWSAAVDDFSNLDEYRVVAPAVSAAVPTTTNAGVRRASSITNDTLSIIGQQGVITGFVFAIDDDNDRSGDRAVGNLRPVVVRVDTNPPPRAQGLRATDAANANLFGDIDESSEIKVEWTPGGTSEAQAAGWRQSDSAPLSPWDSYHITYYEVADTNGAEMANAITNVLTRTNSAWSGVLNNYAFTNLVLSNLIFDTYYRIDIRGRDAAGNIGLATSVIGNTDRFIVTQGLARVDRDLEVRWTGDPISTSRWYDVLYVDGPMGFRNSMSNQWQFMQLTNRPAMYDNGTATPIKPGDLTNTTYRFYRVARPGRWETNNATRVASAEIYVAKAMKLHEGENWHSLFSFPDPATTNEAESTVSYVFGTNLLPRGESLIEGATKISWFGNENMVNSSMGSVATAVVYLANSGWKWHIGGTPESDANNKRIPLGQGFLIEIPPGEGSTNLILIGRVPTQEVVHVVAGSGGSTNYHILSQQIPERITIANLGITTNNGFRGGPNIGQSDEIRILNNRPVTGVVENVEYPRLGSGSLVAPKARIWWRTSDNTWRHAASANYASGAAASGYVVEPDDTVIIVRRHNTELIWTNRPVMYNPPTRNFTP
jgi:hypothetical protein